MLRAVIFDFNGVIIDDEPLHFRATQAAVAQVGIEITEEEYYAQYLPFDDVRCLGAICRNHIGLRARHAVRVEQVHENLVRFRHVLLGLPHQLHAAFRLLRSAPVGLPPASCILSY